MCCVEKITSKLFSKQNTRSQHKQHLKLKPGNHKHYVGLTEISLTYIKKSCAV